MSTSQRSPISSADPTLEASFEFAVPTVSDAADMWRIARDSGSLDLNSSYAYLLWCAHFSATSAVVKHEGTVVGYVTGYAPPEHPDTLMVWQIAVAEEHRGHGLALGLLNTVINRTSPRWLRTTIDRSNTASIRLFTALADQRHTIVSRTDMFAASDFPDSHEPEDLYVVGPLDS